MIKEKLVERTDVRVNQLDGVAQDRLENGVKFNSRKDAEAYIARLPTTTSSTTTSTVFGATTTTVLSTSTTKK